MILYNVHRGVIHEMDCATMKEIVTYYLNQNMNLSEADLTGANLSEANLSWANLFWANLTGAKLSGADLTNANLTNANLTGANLTGANLLDSINYSLSVANTRILPDDGDVIGWKKCKNEVLVKLLIPADAKRNNAFGRKCRANKAIVLDIIGADEAVSNYDDSFKYRKGETVEVEYFDEKFWDECSTGIHFFITRLEAENY